MGKKDEYSKDLEFSSLKHETIHSNLEKVKMSVTRFV